MAEEKRPAAGDMDYIESVKNNVQYVKDHRYDKYSWSKPPKKVPEEEIAQTITTEVAIVGGGIAGLSAGARLTQLGIKCIVVEKYRGIVARGAHIAALESKCMEENGVHIDKQQFARDWMHICGSRVNEDLLWLYINKSGPPFSGFWTLAATTLSAPFTAVTTKGRILPNTPAPISFLKKRGILATKTKAAPI